MSEFLLRDCKLIQVSVDEVGPFRQGPQTFSFLGDAVAAVGDSGTTPGPSNLYMLLAKNAHGKTTLLECIHGLFGLLCAPAVGRFAGGQVGRSQVDMRASWVIDGKLETVLLSLWTGDSEPLVTWSEQEVDEIAQADRWARLGVFGSYGQLGFYDRTDPLGLRLYQEIQAAHGRAPTALFGASEHLPTVLLFPADRALQAPVGERIVQRPANWGYQPAQVFATDGETWATSVDNLLVWLEWLDDGRIKDLLAFVNQHIFGEDLTKTIRPPRREDLLTYVDTAVGPHPLSDLSHGERALLQLLVRTATHMTGNTIILIDEVEIHLHSRWMNRFFQALKGLLVGIPTLSCVFTTHNREMIKVFDHLRPEPGLVKGGFLIEDELL